MKLATFRTAHAGGGRIGSPQNRLADPARLASHLPWISAGTFLVSAYMSQAKPLCLTPGAPLAQDVPWLDRLH